MASHSEKAVETLRQMGTAPGDWHLTPIKWVKELRVVVGLVTCPACDGHRWVRLDEHGRAIPAPKVTASYADDYATYLAQSRARDEYLRLAREEENARRKFNYDALGNCQACARKKRGYRCSSGYVRGPVEMEVMVGYPQFPPGALFDSRFRGGCHCDLCNKLILKSGRVPVDGVGADGVAHAMWVGEDCARKFLNVKVKRPKDSVMEDPEQAP